MKLTKRGNRWYDKNDNSWDTEELATLHSPTLTNCRCCSDCSSCSYCRWCSSCSSCAYCSNCSSCIDCSYCGHCSDCNNCSGCTYCRDRKDYHHNVNSIQDRNKYPYFVLKLFLVLLGGTLILMLVNYLTKH